MKMRVLLFLIGLLIKETVTAWFLFTRGLFHLSHAANIAVAAFAALLMATVTIGLVRISSVAHSDPDSAWIGWIRFFLWSGFGLFGTALVALQPLAGAPALALAIFAGWVSINERRRERAAADEQTRALPTVPAGHADAARQRFGHLDGRGKRSQQFGPDRRGLLDGDPRAGRRTKRVLPVADTGISIHEHL